MSQDLANYIAAYSVREIRSSPIQFWPTYSHDQWLKGRASTAAAVFPSVETVAADNEAQFLVHYNHRHGVYK